MYVCIFIHIYLVFLDSQFGSILNDEMRKARSHLDLCQYKSTRVPDTAGLTSKKNDKQLNTLVELVTQACF